MTQTNFANGYALLIGVGNCNYSSWSLPVTVKDAEALKGLLTDPDLCAYPDDAKHVRLLHDGTATRQGILEGLAWLQERVAADGAATAVIYFSGHGWLDGQTERYYLIPSDTKPFDIPGSAVAAEEFTVVLRQITAERLLVFIDSCHAEGMATAKDEPVADLPPNFSQMAPPKSVITALKQGEGRAVFTSSRGNQKSWIRSDKSLSIYTHHLLEALRGAANRAGETAVHLSHLMAHLGQTVPVSAQEAYQAEQTPFFDMAAEDFAVALLCGGKGLAAGGGTASAPAPTQGGTTIHVHGSGNVIGDRNVSQSVQASGGSSISGVTQIAGNVTGGWPGQSGTAGGGLSGEETAVLLALRNKLTSYFNLSEIRDLCFQLGFSHESLAGQTREEIARELVLYLRQRQRLGELRVLVRHLRPKVEW